MIKMNDFRYILTPYKGPASRYRCPSCNQSRKFSLYIDNETGEPLADYVGRCDREEKCGHHYTPRQYFADNPQQGNTGRAVAYRANIMQAAPRPVEYLPANLMEQSRQQFNTNHLWKFFTNKIGEPAANIIFDKYRVGTSKHWPGATAFWQVDPFNRVRQCKVMLYDPATGRRVKQEGQTYIAFMGKKLLGNPDAVLQQCFFGSHLLPLYPLAPVAIVESEKTAMYCAHFYPNMIWLATGGKQGCKWTDKAVFETLKGRTVVLFPDLMATADWKEKAEKVKTMVSCKIHVSTDLENMATDADKAAGFDLMDYLLLQKAAPNTLPYTADAPPIGPKGCPVARDEAPAPVENRTKNDTQKKSDPAPVKLTASNIQTPVQKAVNEDIKTPNIYFSLQWFINEAKDCFKRSMVKDAAIYYRAFILSYRPTLRREGINESALRDALIL